MHLSIVSEQETTKQTNTDLEDKFHFFRPHTVLPVYYICLMSLAGHSWSHFGANIDYTTVSSCHVSFS